MRAARDRLVTTMAIVMAAAACDRAPDRRDRPSAAAPASAPPSTSASRAPMDATSKPAPIASASAASSASTVDSAWPAGTRTIALTWVLHPVVLHGSVTARHVDVVARAGAVARTASIDVRATTMFILQMQSLCTHEARERGTVAELFMNGGGNFRMTAERPAPDVLEIHANEYSDGLCVDDAGRDMACPVARALLARWDVPRDARIVESFAEIVRDDTDAGPETGAPRRHALECP